MAEGMGDRVKRLYKAGRIDNNGLANAVKRGLITEGEFYSLTLITYDEFVNGRAGENNENTEAENENSNHEE